MFCLFCHMRFVLGQNELNICEKEHKLKGSRKVVAIWSSQQTRLRFNKDSWLIATVQHFLEVYTQYRPWFQLMDATHWLFAHANVTSRSSKWLASRKGNAKGVCVHLSGKCAALVLVQPLDVETIAEQWPLQMWLHLTCFGHLCYAWLKWLI